MSEDLIQKTTLYHYFLGMLSEQEQEQLEEEYFAQPERRQELWAIFDEMVDRFGRGEMKSQEARHFAVQLQTKPALRARAERLHTLYHFLSQTPLKNQGAEPQVSELSLRPLRKWFALPTWGWGVLAAGVLLLGAIGLWRSRNDEKQEPVVAQATPTTTISIIPATPVPMLSPLQPKPETLPQQPHRSTIKPFYVLLEDVRGRGEATKLTITEQTQTIALHFEVQPSSQANYQAVVETNTGQAFKSFSILKARTQKGTSFVTLRLAVAEIPSSDFAIQIKSTSAEKNVLPVISQTFRLEKE